MRRLPIALLAPLLLATACTGDPQTESLASGDGYSVLGALSEVPVGADGEQIMVTTGDLAEASRLSGLARPDDVADRDAVNDWIGPLLGSSGADRMHAPVMVPLGSLLSQHAIADMAGVDEELGWSLLDVDAFVEVTAAPDNFAVVLGEGIAPDEDLPEVTDGVVTAGEGEDHEADVGAVTPARPIGAPLRMAQSGTALAVSPTTSLVQAWASGGESLADDEALAAVAAAFDEVGVVSAVLAKGHSMDVATVLAGRGGSQEQVEAMLAEYEELVPTGPFAAVGLGFGVDGDEPRATVVLHLADDAAAQAAVPVLQRQYTEGNSLLTGRPLADTFELLDAAADGPLAVLQLTPAQGVPVHTAFQQLLAGDLPFAHR